MKTVAVLSMLHEPAGANSATRLFRRQPVLWWTLARLSGATGKLAGTAVLCFDDQADGARACVGEAGVHVHSIGPRRPLCRRAARKEEISVSRPAARAWPRALQTAIIKG